MEFQQFEDSPQIHFTTEDYFRSSRWPFHPEADLGMIPQLPSSNRSLLVAGVGLHSETGSYSLPPMDPMDRFVQDFDALPFSPELLHADRRMKDFAVRPPYEPTTPELYYRHGSPTTEVSSPSQSCDTFSASTDELHRCSSMDFRGSISSPLDCHQAFLQHGTLGFSAQSPELLGGGSVSLDQVQNFQDTGFDNEHSHSELDADCDSEQDVPIVRVLSGMSYPHPSEDEGLGESIQDSLSERFDDEDEEDPEYNPKSTNRSPKVAKVRPTTISRRSSHGRKLSTGSVKSRVTKPKNKKSAIAGAVRPFPCPLANYGCHSTFTSKNEWKRHVSTQHIKLGFWRCDMCPQTDPHNIIYNDFNRKDLFTQHLRRMHATHALSLEVQSATTLLPNAEGQIIISDEAILAHQERCYRKLRSNPPRSSCLFCSRTFQGDGGWDERMEHVGAHFEQERKRGGKLTGQESWREDHVLQEWLVQEGLIEYEALTGWRIGDGQPRRRDSVVV